MCNWLKWILPGLITVLLLGIIAALYTAPAVEQELAQAARKTLANDHGWGQVRLDGRDLTLTGTAPLPEAKIEAETLIEQVWDVRTIVNHAGVLPVESPYGLDIAQANGKIILNGFAPNKKVKQEIEELAKTKTGIPVDNQLKLARGAPNGLIDAVGMSLTAVSGLNEGQATISDRAVSLSGAADTYEAYERTMAAVNQAMPEGYTLASETISKPYKVMSPYKMSMVRDGEMITLNGHAPSEEVRGAIAVAIKHYNPEAKIANNLELASGVPEGMDWNRLGEYAAQQMSLMPKGTISATNRDLLISGDVSDGQTKTKIIDSFPQVQALGIAKIEEEILDLSAKTPASKPVPGWYIAKDSTHITVGGAVPDEKTANANFELVSQAFPSNSVVIFNQEIDAKAPSAFASSTRAAILIASRLEQGKVELDGDRVVVQGSAYHQKSADNIKSAIAKLLPQGTQSQIDIAVKDPAQIEKVPADQCQNILNNILKFGTIRFPSGKSDIESSSFGLLDQLAYTTMRCPDSRVRISGHTDSSGSAQTNKTISEARAGAVRQYLLDSGISGNRIDAVGYGPDKPIASNDTEEGRAKNRRIEFEIIQ